jgi:HK97 family phage portal protein
VAQQNWLSRFFGYVSQRITSSTAGDWLPLSGSVMMGTKRRWLSRSQAAQMEQVLESEWEAISVTRMIDAVMQADFEIQDAKTKKVFDDPNHPLIKLFQQPNSYQDHIDFLERVLIYLLPAGNAFIYLNPMSVGKTPMAMHVLDPRLVRIIRDPKTFIKEYQYQTSTGSLSISPDEMVHIKFPDIFDTHWGMGRVGMINRVFENDESAVDYNDAFFKNDAMPGFTLNSDGTLGKEEKDKIKKSINQIHQGSRNAFKMMILEGGLKLNQMNQTTPKEAAFIQTRKSNREAILAINGIQPMLAGITENSNRASAYVQEKLFAKYGLAPIQLRLSKKFTKIAQKFGNFIYTFKTEHVEDTELEAALTTAYFNCGGLTPRQVAARSGNIIEEKNPELDKHYIPLNMIAIEDQNAQPVPAGNQPPASNPNEPVKAPGEKPADQGSKPGAVGPVAGPKEIGHVHGMQTKGAGTPIQRRVLKHFHLRQSLEIKKFRPRISTFFKQLGEVVIEAYLKSKKGFEKSTIDMIWETAFAIPTLEELSIPLDMAGNEIIWSRFMKNIYIQSLGEEYQVTAELLGYDPSNKISDFAPGNHRFDKKLHYLASKVRVVADTTRQELSDVITEGVNLGLGPADIANGDSDLGYKGIRGLFDEFSQSRSELIARTETSRLLDQANVACYQDMGVNRCDVIGCEDDEVMAGQRFGCNSENIPILDADSIEFHPNHTGAIVPRIESVNEISGVLTRMILFGKNHSKDTKQLMEA